MHSTYLLIDLGAVAVPLLCSFHPRLQFYRQWRAFWPANLIIATLFICWDVLFTNWQVWGFNARYICGWRLFNLPIEEVLFFICIPYACLFSYHCLNKLWSTGLSRKTARLTSPLLIVILLTAGLYYHQRIYTCTTFIATATALFLLHYRLKTPWLGQFYLCYLVMLLPFFIVNGLLTGTGLQEPIVWYNNNENMGIRLLTIPLEDVFYGMLLLLLNTFLYEYFGARKTALRKTHKELLEA